MMGKNHALSGAVVGVATLPAVTPLLHLQYTGVGLYIVTTTGAAMLPDIDHPGSGVSRTFGPVTRPFAWLVGKLSGGHRNGTHSHFGVANLTMLGAAGAALQQHRPVLLLVGFVAATLLTASGFLIGLMHRALGIAKLPHRTTVRNVVTLTRAAAYLLIVCGIALACLQFGQAAGQWIVGLLTILTMAAAVRVLRIKGYLDDIAPIPITLWMLHDHADFSALPIALALGALTHIAGDQVTKGGCPVAWPVSQRMVGLHLFKTNSPFEHKVITPVLGCALVAAVALVSLTS